MFQARVWSNQTFFAYWNDRCDWRLRFYRPVGIVEKYIFHCCAIDRLWISHDLWPGFGLWSSRQQKLQISLWLSDLHICPRADFYSYGYVRVGIQVKTGSGSLKRPALPLLRSLGAFNCKSFFYGIYKCVHVRARGLSSSGAEIWQPECDARGNHSEKPCRFPWGIMGAGKQVNAWMAPNFALLSSGKKGFLLSCSFCKKKKTDRKHISADSQVPYKTWGRRMFCLCCIGHVFRVNEISFQGLISSCIIIKYTHVFFILYYKLAE